MFFLKKIIFQNRYVALETPSRPPPLMAKNILNFHFGYLNPSLREDINEKRRFLSGIARITYSPPPDPISGNLAFFGRQNSTTMQKCR